MKITSIISVILAIMLFPGFSYCYNGFHDPQMESQTVEGQICGVDLFYSDIVVKKVSYHDQITIHVPRNVSIYKKDSVVSLEDIQEGDNVAVDYYNDSPGPLKALKITVTG